jgi:hypothetical protein
MSDALNASSSAGFVLANGAKSGHPCSMTISGDVRKYPNREQAVRIQQALESLYKSVEGEYRYADAAWAYVKHRTGVNLLGILQDLAAERTAQHGQ